MPEAMTFSMVCGCSPAVEVAGPQALVNQTPPADLYTMSERHPLPTAGHVSVTDLPVTLLVTWKVPPGCVKLNCITPPLSRPLFPPFTSSYKLYFAVNVTVFPSV